MYSFEGQYRRVPKQNLAGASIQQKTDELLNKVHRDRMKREVNSLIPFFLYLSHELHFLLHLYRKTVENCSVLFSSMQLSEVTTSDSDRKKMSAKNSTKLCLIYVIIVVREALH